MTLACVDVMEAKSKLALANDNLHSLEGIVTLNQRRVSGGAIAPVELVRSRVAMLIVRILIDAPHGARSPLEDVATLAVRGGSMNIAHESGKRLASIGVFLRDRDMGSAVAEMQRRVRQSVGLSPGYFIVWGGEFENHERAMARLRIIVPLSIFLIFLLLVHAFGSVKSALQILSNIPFALVGGILALLVTRIPLSVSAAIGFIALFGQAVLNGVVIVSYFNALRSQGLDAQAVAVEGRWSASERC